MRARPRRNAFTLVELLVVMIVVGILVALLLPVIGGAIRSSKNAAVAAEFQILSASLEAFKEKYGDYPPSRIMVCEDGFWNTADDTMIPVEGGSDITYGQLANRSLAAIRKFWPGVPTSTTDELFDGTGTWFDFDGDGVFDGATTAGGSGTAGRGIILDGAECLCFFLGGVPLHTGTTGDPQISLSGFAKGNVAFTAGSRALPHPFRNNLDNGNLAYGQNRSQSSHEFLVSRLIDVDGDGMPEYADQLIRDKPIAYFRSGNPGYDPNDVNFPELPLGGTAKSAVRAFRVAHVVAKAKAAGNDVRLAISPAPNPYSSSAAHQNADETLVPTVAWHKPNSFQLISPGADGLYGLGGQYDPNKSVKLPAEAGTANTNDTDPGLRDVERDNIGNFASGPLD